MFTLMTARRFITFKTVEKSFTQSGTKPFKHKLNSKNLSNLSRESREKMIFEDLSSEEVE